MKIAIITGASSGMGREFARSIDKLAEVDELWLVARREQRLKELASELKTPARVFPLDLTDVQSVYAIAAELEKVNPEVKYLVSGAGYGKFGSFDQIPDSDATGMIDLNVRALTLMSQKTAPYMQKGDRIINVASISAYMPLENLAIYAATKAFVLSYSYALGAELKKQGVTVTAVCPGWAQTEFFVAAANGEQAKGPKKIRPIADPKKVVKKAMRAARHGKKVSIYGVYWKAMHVMSKLFPKKISMAIWHSMQKK